MQKTYASYLAHNSRATKRGYAAGYWNGERVLKDVDGKTGYNFDVVGIKQGRRHSIIFALVGFEFENVSTKSFLFLLVL